MENRYPVPNPEVIGRMVDGDAVLLLPGKGKIKVLNAVASRIWALSDGVRSIDQIAALISGEYAVDIAQAAADVAEFVQQMAARDLVTISPVPVKK